MWFDASDAGAVFADTNGSASAAYGGTIGRLEDKSGNCRHLSQSASGSRPVFLKNAASGLSGIRFSSTTSLGNTFDAKRYLDRELTYIMACVPKSGSSGSHLVAGGTLSTSGVRGFGVTTTAINYGTYNADTPNTSALFSVDRVVVIGVTVTSSLFVQKWFRGRVVQSTQLAYTNTQFSGMYLNGLGGASFRSPFDFCEAMIFGRRIGEDEMRTLMLAMMEKWGA